MFSIYAIGTIFFLAVCISLDTKTLRFYFFNLMCLATFMLAVTILETMYHYSYYGLSTLITRGCLLFAAVHLCIYANTERKRNTS